VVPKSIPIAFLVEVIVFLGCWVGCWVGLFLGWLLGWVVSELVDDICYHQLTFKLIYEMNYFATDAAIIIAAQASLNAGAGACNPAASELCTCSIANALASSVLGTQ
jgi:NhaP-type Na+/H+ or K+/H+ antiporter